MSKVIMLKVSLLSLSTGLASAIPTHAPCKCAPDDSCWPSALEWGRLNASLSGKLIAGKPLAKSCYPGPDYDETTCASVAAGWSSARWMGDQPMGLDYPLNITCPVVSVAADLGITPAQCTMGTDPVYAVNATEIDDVVAAVKFAKRKNLRVVIKSTGHDILGRSDGYGSLLIWLRYLRNGLTVQDTYEPHQRCNAQKWPGGAVKIAGLYTWGEVYAASIASDFVIVGGGAKTVSSIGGWMQGAGHGPASHYYGLGADQLLEAEVVLASGEVVTANACQDEDLYFAIRGGGPGTYGIVVSATVKTHPNVHDIQVHRLFAGAPANVSRDTFLDALAVIYGEYPDLVQAGFAGYPNWQVQGPMAVNGVTTFYTHALSMFNAKPGQAAAAGRKLLDNISQFNSSLIISSSYTTYPDYWTFYDNVGNHDTVIGYMGATGNRFLDAKALSNRTAIRNTLDVIAGQPGENVNNAISLVAGGRVAADRSEASAVHPAWRDAVAINTLARAMISVTPTQWQEIHDDITYTKMPALKALAPDTGSYMNEEDRFNPDWKKDFYGVNFARLSRIKSKYDPTSLFYCPTCVGSERWDTDSMGRLCVSR